METHTISAIVLRRSPFREKDLKIAVFSQEEGRIELIARGGKKISSKLAAHLEPLNLVKIMVVPGKNFDYAGAVESVECFLGIKKDYEKSRQAGIFFHQVLELINGKEKDERIFLLFLDFLKNLSGDCHAENLRYATMVRLINFLGFLPELSNNLRQLCLLPLNEAAMLEINSGDKKYIDNLVRGIIER